MAAASAGPAKGSSASSSTSSSSRDIVIGVVGKPSVGKSTLFNAVTEGKAKVGNFPFTTIEPNMGVTYYRAPCASVSRGKAHLCRPRYGRLRSEDGMRFIPVKLLDVAGLVPGASEGAGLGNKFLNDLCGADVLIHIIDVSGTTNEKGEATVGYDPVNDAEWLIGELRAWVLANLWGKWPATARRHTATKSSVVDTFQSKLSGYGANRDMIIRTIEVMEKAGNIVRDPCDLAAWNEDHVRRLVDAFLQVRFPMVLLLNKADQSGAGECSTSSSSLASDTDRNITKVVEKYEPQGVKCVVGSAQAELFLKTAKRKGFIDYLEGEADFLSLKDGLEDIKFRRSRLQRIPSVEAQAEGSAQLNEEERQLRSRLVAAPADSKVEKRLERVKDMVMYRFGGTGVWAAVQAAVDLKKPAVAYPVRSLTSFATEIGPGGGGSSGKGIFADCHLLREGTTIKQLAGMVLDGLACSSFYAEGEDGRRLAEDQVITGVDFVVRFVVSAPSNLSASSNSSSGSSNAAAGGGGGSSSSSSSNSGGGGGSASNNSEGRKGKGGASSSKQPGGMADAPPPPPPGKKERPPRGR